MRTYCVLIFSFLLVSCAGPTNPFGSDLSNIFDIQNDYEKRIPTDNFRQTAGYDEKITIEFFPKMQNWHRTHDIFVHIKSESSPIYLQNIRFFWDHKDVTNTIFRNYDVILQNPRDLIIKLNDIRLRPSDDNQIFVYYSNINNGQIFGQEYLPPRCILTEDQNVANTRPFKVKKSFLKLVDKQAEINELNPSLLTALIAQESGFNYKAVSYAKAIGLTQVTNLASAHVKRKYRRWKSDKRISKLPAPIIRAMVRMGKITRKHDWRLDKEKSVIGGIEYINYLENYWMANENIINRSYGNHINKDQILTDLILSSYNSGPYRTKSELIANGRQWKDAKSLKEAKNYINKIKSYCYHFSSDGDSNERQAANF
jgi:hypothetical protein